MERVNWHGALMVLGAAALWGTIGLLSRLLYQQGLTPIQVVAGRIGLTWIVFTLAAALGDRRSLRIGLRDAGFFAVYGLVSVALFYGCWFYAVSRLPVAVAVILLYTAPAYVTLLSAPLFGERLTLPKLAALALTLAGAALVAGRPAGGTIPMDGLLAGLGSGLTYGLYSLFGKAAAPRYSRSATLFYTFSFGLLGVALVGWAQGDWSGPPPAWAGSPMAWLLLALLALGPTVTAYYLYAGGLERIDASVASMLATLEPVVSVVLAAAVLHEPLRWPQGLGGAMVVGAVLLLQQRPSSAGKPAPSAEPTPRAEPPEKQPKGIMM